jgi:hypothetical protein
MDVESIVQKVCGESTSSRLCRLPAAGEQVARPNVTQRLIDVTRRVFSRLVRSLIGGGSTVEVKSESATVDYSQYRSASWLIPQRNRREGRRP